MNHLDRHPDEDADHKERDQLKRQISTLTSFIDRRVSENKDTKNRIQKYRKRNNDAMNELKHQVGVDFRARSEALKDNDLKSDPVLKRKDEKSSNKK